jgi:4-amino-4-deoxy-L-arabinose transferase-like glycosyltransferase
MSGRVFTGLFTAAVVALALVLRLWAIDWGAPYLYHPDEHLVLHPALNIVRSGDLNPHWFQYPSLLIYVEAAIVAVGEPFVHAPLTTGFGENHTGPWDALPAQWPFALGGRLAVAAFAVCGACLLYRVGRLYSDDRVGIAAALFLVASPLHNESSHFLTTDVPATTLLTTALLFSVGTAPADIRRLVLAGLFAGLAAATKYTAGIVLLVPLAVALSRPTGAALRRLGIIAAACGAGFLIGCPFALLDFPAAYGGILEQRQNYLAGYTPGGNWLWYLEYLYTTGLGAPLAIAAAIGLIATLVICLRTGVQELIGKGGRRLRLALVAVPVLYFALIAAYPSRAERNLIIVLPCACLLAADICGRIVRRLAPAAADAGLFGVIVVAIAAPGILGCVQHDRRLALPDTRTLALRWVEANVPAGVHIAREEYTPQVSGERYAVIYEWTLASHDYGWYVMHAVDYFIVSSNVYGRAMQPPYIAGNAGLHFYPFLFYRLPLAAEFAPAADRVGPTIRIYRVPRA